LFDIYLTDEALKLYWIIPFFPKIQQMFKPVFPLA